MLTYGIKSGAGVMRSPRYVLQGHRGTLKFSLEHDNFDLLRAEAHRRLMDGFTVEIVSDKGTVTRFELTKEQKQHVKKAKKGR